MLTTKKALAFSLFWIITLGIGGYAIYQQTSNPINSLPVIEAYSPGADFTMLGIDGNNFTMSNSDGKVRVLTFIYTACPDGCSVITAKMAELRESLQEEDLYNQVQFITIDFDYLFDNMTELKNYAESFMESEDHWEFLLGNEQQTNQTTEAYGFPFQLQNSTDDSDGHDGHSHNHHTYIHPFVVYFIDQSRDVRSMQGGLDWKTEDAYNIVEFLLEE